MVRTLFQTYHSRENVITGNFLFFLNRVRYISEEVYLEFLEEIIGTELVNEIGGLKEISQNQYRENNKNSVPDGLIFRPSYKIVIETKGNGEIFTLNQLKNHLEYFDSHEDIQLLLTLDKQEINSEIDDELNRIIKIEYQNKMVHRHLTFERIIKIFQSILESTREYELIDLVSDYYQYLEDEQLINKNEMLMRVVLSGKSFETNIKYNIYFHPYQKRGYPFKDVEYIGLYKEKSVKAVGKISSVVRTDIIDLDEPSSIKIKHVSGEKVATEELRDELFTLITDEKWAILTQENHYFYIVEEFYKTDYRKVSKGAPMGTRFISLKNELNIERELDIIELSKKLEKIEWY